MTEHGIIKGLREALAFAEGKDTGARIHTPKIPAKVDVRALRRRLKLTQREFAVKFGFPLGTLENWEQGRRSPTGSDRAFLTVIDRVPEIIEKVLSEMA